MACTRCGECCTNLTFSMPNRDYLREFYAVRGAMVRNDGDTISVVVPLPCPHLKYEGKTCTCDIHDRWPEVCRLFFCEKAQEGTT